MYQTVIILLHTAVITIITTVVTVRVTMTGRIVSQEAKTRLKTLGMRYGMIPLNLFNMVGSALNLIFLMTRKAPVGRVDVLLISVTVCTWTLGFIGLVLGVAFAYFFPKIFGRNA